MYYNIIQSIDNMTLPNYEFIQSGKKTQNRYKLFPIDVHSLIISLISYLYVDLFKKFNFVN